MKRKEFLQKNREEIDRIINGAIYRYDGKGGPGKVPDPPPKRNDYERWQWIMNDESLYLWAKSEGLKVVE